MFWVLQALSRLPGIEDLTVLALPSVPLTTVRAGALDSATIGIDAAEVVHSVQTLKVGEEVGSAWFGVQRIPIVLCQSLSTDDDTLL